MNETIEIPHAPEIEAGVLSVVLGDPERWLPRAIADGVGEGHFWLPAHRRLWEVLVERRRVGRSLDVQTLAADLMATGEDLVTPGLLARIWTAATNANHWVPWLEVLRDRLARRIAVQAGLDLAGSEQDGRGAASALRNAAEKAEEALQARDEVVGAREAVLRFLDSLGARAEEDGLPGLGSGVFSLDSVTGGLRPGELWVVAGNTSTGKSVLVLQVAGAALAAGKRVLVCSLEMSCDEVVARLVAAAGRIRLDAILNPRTAGSGEVTRIERCAGELAQSGLLVCDRGGQTVDEICSHAERTRDLGGLDLLVVDYLQLVGVTRNSHRTREQEVAEISRRLKTLSKKLRCPVLTASQLNDQGQVRESRAIAQDADVLLSIVDDGILVAKARNARRGDVLPLRLDGSIQRFVDTA